MKELQIKIRPKEEDVCYYPDEFKRIKFLGIESQCGNHYFRANWASSESNYGFWYPFVGGAEATVFTTIRSEEDINRLYDMGCKFFSFGTAREMYQWLADTVEL